MTFTCIKDMTSGQYKPVFLKPVYIIEMFSWALAFMFICGSPVDSARAERPTRPQHFHASRGPEVEPEATGLLNASSINGGGAELEDESDVGDDPLDLGRYNVLQRVTASHVRMHPFPHLVVRQALPADVYAKLAGSFPGEDVMTEWRHTPRAGRARMETSSSAAEVPAVGLRAARRRLARVWSDFVQFHTSLSFYNEVLRVFKPAIKRARPDMQRLLHKRLEDMAVQMRFMEDEATDLSLDCQVVLTPPVRRHSQGERGAHLDPEQQLWEGTLHFRDSWDDSRGGNMQVFECKEGSRCQPSRKEENEEGDTREKVKGRRARGGHLRFEGSDLDVVVQTPVKRNTLVWFINSNVSIHGDAPREVSPHSRRMVRFTGEMIDNTESGRKRTAVFTQDSFHYEK
mmetsp:Transcript_32350/g.62186  ORF Transcript_32350/g.62186 Transcript_32350/m.62186 type:complete len:401 (-) Transcript_32350:374-1576(-)